MLIPRFKKDYEKKTLEELILEQQAMMNKIIRFENKYILKKSKCNKIDDEILTDPSPTVMWRVLSKDLIMLTELIDEKTRDTDGIGIDFY